MLAVEDHQTVVLPPSSRLNSACSGSLGVALVQLVVVHDRVALRRVLALLQAGNLADNVVVRAQIFPRRQVVVGQADHVLARACTHTDTSRHKTSLDLADTVCALGTAHRRPAGPV